MSPGESNRRAASRRSLLILRGMGDIEAILAERGDPGFVETNKDHLGKLRRPSDRGRAGPCRPIARAFRPNPDGLVLAAHRYLALRAGVLVMNQNLIGRTVGQFANR